MRFIRILLLVSLVALVVAPAALALRFTDESYMTPVGVTGQPYFHKFDGAAGCGPALPYQYRILDGTLPTGLRLSKEGIISGVPEVAGTWSFWVELSDEDPPSQDWCRPSKAERQFTIKITTGLNIVQNSLSRKVTFVSEPYSFQFSAEGGGTQTWSIQSGKLPAGLTLNSSSGLLSGTPTEVGDFTFKVMVTDGGRTDSETYTLTVVPQLKIAGLLAAASEVGRPFELKLQATGGKPDYTWSLAAGSVLPAGLTLDPLTGVISGEPEVAGSYAVKLSVTDKLGLSVTVDVKLAVAAKLTIAKKALAAAKARTPFRARLAVTGGVAPRTWKIVRGALPLGLRLNAKTGDVAGIARRAGTSRFTVQVSDKLGAVSTRAFVLKVLR
jgi:Putative Ig domain